MNATHDPTLRSWVESANVADADFPIQNLPFGVFRRRDSAEPFRGGVAIGDQILDLMALSASNMLDGLSAEACRACCAPTLNAYLALGARHWGALRKDLSRLLARGADCEATLSALLVPQAAAELALPMQVGDYTDFYTSIHHASRVGALFRPDQPLLPNYRWVPIAYHGRSSSIVVSGTPVRRPLGQVLPAGEALPRVQPSARLDYEAELGMVVGPNSPLGAAVSMTEAASHVYGVCLLNDWSARDLQTWEYQPLGPFAAKNFATTLSPWLVSLEALEPFRVPFTRAEGEPAPLPHLDSADDRARGALDIQMETRLQTATMRAQGVAPELLARSSYRHAYWTLAQMVAHHTLNGCPLRAGDVLGTGTVSGPSVEEAGCLLELTQAGKRPLALEGGETRAFLQDGDVVELRAFCVKAGAARIGFGTATGMVLPAPLT